MKYVNEALGGMWLEVALGETGSLVVQNIFENCLEEDKVCNVYVFYLITGANSNPYSVHALRRFLPISTSSPTVNLEIGVYSIFASMVLLATAAAPSIMSYAML
jgi:hypothetical protein